MTLLLVLLGGAIGAPLRYLADAWVSRRTGSDAPWGTLAVNVAGSFVLGVLATAAPSWLVTLGGVGLCGALTTFSTFSVETMRLLQLGDGRRALLNVGCSLVVGIGAVAGGWWLGSLA